MSAPIQIRNKDVVDDIRLLAVLSGQPITRVVADAVRARLAEVQLKKRGEIGDKLRKIRSIQKRIRKLPVVGRPLTDADIYDENGLPR
jgi:hypothetical protein